MDRTLLEEHKRFKQRAATSLAFIDENVSKRIKTDNNGDESYDISKQSPRSTLPASDIDNQYFMKNHLNKSRFGLLATVIQFLLNRYHEFGNQKFFSLREICGIVGLSIQHDDFEWLNNHALQSNPKIFVDPNNITKFRYNPKYSFQDASDLLLTLKALQTFEGSGISIEDINECFGDSSKILHRIQNKIHIISKNKNKSPIVFYKDLDFTPCVDEEIQKLWRGISLDGKDSLKIEQYLTKRGLGSLKDNSELSHSSANAIKKPGQKKSRINSKLFNTHLGGLLKDFNK